MGAETDRRIEAMGVETDLRIKETDRQIEETDRQIKETDRQIKETDRQMKETARQMKETDKRIGEITGRFGNIVEHMVVPNLEARFRELGFIFTRVSRNIKITGENNHVFAEIDAFLENGDKVMVVETKTKPGTGDINEHIERMEKLRVYAGVQDRRKYLGAVAGVVFDDSVKGYALKNGFYVLEPSGETFAITEPKARGYTPREW
jgi:seryl-tRNA synthetase